MKMKFPQNVTVHIDSTGCHHQRPADGVLDVSDPNMEAEFLHAGFVPVEAEAEPVAVEEDAQAAEKAAALEAAQKAVDEAQAALIDASDENKPAAEQALADAKAALEALQQ